MKERTLYCEFGKQAGNPNSGIVGEVFEAARRRPWEAVRYGLGAPVELDNLEQDPGGEVDLSKSKPKNHAGFVRLFEGHKN